jgi:hypothetical protein
MRTRALAALGLTEAITLLLAALFYLRGRPAIVAAFEAYDTPMPWTTALAVATWFLPALGLVSLASFAIGLLAPMRRSRQMTLASSAVVLAGFGLVYAIIAALYPFFQPA